jgi:hypothetical protein
MLSLGSSILALGLNIGVFIESEVYKKEIKDLNAKVRVLQDKYNSIGLDLKGVVDFFKDSSDVLTDLQANGQLL